MCLCLQSPGKFLSTLPARGATALSLQMAVEQALFLSTLPARGATDTTVHYWDDQEISIHAPREGSDESSMGDTVTESEFLSTLPARGATGVEPGQGRQEVQISIHAPREGSDALTRRGRQRVSNFYPRSPRGERLIGSE